MKECGIHGGSEWWINERVKVVMYMILLICRARAWPFTVLIVGSVRVENIFVIFRHPCPDALRTSSLHFSCSSLMQGRPTFPSSSSWISTCIPAHVSDHCWDHRWLWLLIVTQCGRAIAELDRVCFLTVIYSVLGTGSRYVGSCWKKARGKKSHKSNALNCAPRKLIH